MENAVVSDGSGAATAATSDDIGVILGGQLTNRDGPGLEEARVTNSPVVGTMCRQLWHAPDVRPVAAVVNALYRPPNRDFKASPGTLRIFVAVLPTVPATALGMPAASGAKLGLSKVPRT
jgi:hypothetical protein